MNCLKKVIAIGSRVGRRLRLAKRQSMLSILYIRLPCLQQTLLNSYIKYLSNNRYFYTAQICLKISKKYNIGIPCK